MRKIKAVVALLSGIVVIFYSCSKGEETEVENCNVTYNAQISTMLEYNCLSCHSGRYYPDLRGFDNARLWARKIETRVVVEQSMPPQGVVSQADKEMITCWINGGMQR